MYCHLNIIQVLDKMESLSESYSICDGFLLDCPSRLEELYLKLLWFSVHFKKDCRKNRYQNNELKEENELLNLIRTCLRSLDKLLRKTIAADDSDTNASLI